MEITILVCTLIATVAAVIALLPLFGFDLKVWGRGTERYTPPNNRKPKWRWVALGSAILSVGLSSFAAYRFSRPRIVEKTVERAVERIVEKPVAAPCPAKETKRPRAHPPETVSQTCSNGICNAGDNNGTQTVINHELPPPQVFWNIDATKPMRQMVDKPSLALWVKIYVDRAFVDAKFAVICDRPCKAVDDQLLIPGGGFMQSTFGKIPENNKIAASIISGPNPLSSDDTYMVCIESEDDKPIKILDVTRLTITPKH